MSGIVEGLSLSILSFRLRLHIQYLKSPYHSSHPLKKRLALAKENSDYSSNYIRIADRCNLTDRWLSS